MTYLEAIAQSHVNTSEHNQQKRLIFTMHNEFLPMQSILKVSYPTYCGREETDYYVEFRNSVIMREDSHQYLLQIDLRLCSAQQPWCNADYCVVTEIR